MKGLLGSKLVLPLVTVVMFATAVLIPLSGNAIHSRAAGTDLYVNASIGSDSNDGSQSAPFATIAKAASLVTPGTTVHVAPGYYPQALYTKISGTATARIVFVSDTKWGAKITPTSVDSSTGNAIWSAWGDYVDIQGFEVYGGGSNFNGFEGIKNYGNYVRITGNKVHDIGNSGCDGTTGGAGIIMANYSGRDDDILGNLVYNIGPSTDCVYIHGIYPANYGGHVSDNIVYGVSGYGIHFWHAATAVICSDNLTFNNRYGGIIMGAGDAPGGVVFDNSIISNNMVVDNTGFGIREFEYSGDNSIGTNNQFYNNLVYGNTDPSGAFVLLNGNTADNTVTANPQFINYQPDGGGDYHLTATSPAIGAGTSIGNPSTDFDGIARPQDNRYDIGVYEYVFSPIPQASVAPTDTLIPTPTNTPQPTFTSTPTVTPTNTLIPTPTNTPQPTFTSTPTVTSTPSLIVDTTPPIVDIRNPGNGSTVRRRSTVIITASASDNIAVTKVKFLVNGTLLCTDTTAPYTCNWYVHAQAGMKYIITARAYDSAGNVSSRSITVSSR